MRVGFRADGTNEDLEVALLQYRRSHRNRGQEVVRYRFGDFAVPIQCMTCQYLNLQPLIGLSDYMPYRINKPCEGSESRPSRVSSHFSRELNGSARSNRTSLRAESALSNPRTYHASQGLVSASKSNLARKKCREYRIVNGPRDTHQQSESKELQTPALAKQAAAE